jgi:hypothetical protein
MWLRSQVSQVEELQVKIEGGDRQILSGYIPQVSLSSRYAVYQGLHLSQIQAIGENIRINLSQVLKGKPLQLLEPILVRVQLLLQEDDLKASLQSPLLSNALSDLLGSLLKSQGLGKLATSLDYHKIVWEKVAIDTDQLILEGCFIDATGKTIPVIIRTSLHLASSRELQLSSLHIQFLPELSVENLDGLQIDLGSEVNIQELTLMPRQIVCEGQLQVLP